MRFALRHAALALLLKSSLAICLTACTPSKQPASHDIQADESASIDAPIDEKFHLVLDEFTALNQRLERISARLKRANADLCRDIEANIGLSTHTLKDYPDELQPAARYYLGVGPDMSVRAVRQGSPADAAGLRAGDQIISVNTQSLTDGLVRANPDLSGPIAKALLQGCLLYTSPSPRDRG